MTSPATTAVPTGTCSYCRRAPAKTIWEDRAYCFRCDPVRNVANGMARDRIAGSSDYVRPRLQRAVGAARDAVLFQVRTLVAIDAGAHDAVLEAARRLREAVALEDDSCRAFRDYQAERERYMKGDRCSRAAWEILRLRNGLADLETHQLRRVEQPPGSPHYRQVERAIPLAAERIRQAIATAEQALADAGGWSRPAEWPAPPACLQPAQEPAQAARLAPYEPDPRD